MTARSSFGRWPDTREFDPRLAASQIAGSVRRPIAAALHRIARAIDPMS